MKNNLEQLAKLIRYYILTSTTEAKSGHPSSSLSAVEVMTALMFGGFFKTDLENPENSNNDRLIFSKGHASPLFYALYAVAGQWSSFAKAMAGESTGQSAELKRPFDPKELLTLRKFNSRFEGHPTMEFPYTEVPTGSLGQGLSVGVGMALNAKLDKLDYRTYVLLGDSEMAEGSVYEAMALASHYELNNLVAIVDVNRLGQRGETMLGYDEGDYYHRRAGAFGWESMVIEGHNYKDIVAAFNSAYDIGEVAKQGFKKPFMIIAKTVKGKGVSFIENKDNWHGKPLSADELKKALEELGEVDKGVFGVIERPTEISKSKFQISNEILSPKFTNYEAGKAVATRKAYGNALANLVDVNPDVIVLDAETSNSTYADSVKKNHPEKFVECFIAEQNMVGMASGFARRGKIPFVSTFAAFFSRAFDQVRMSQYAHANIKFIGSHAGVSIGEDGSSQMALEDIGMFRSIRGSVVLYPSDAVSTEKLVGEASVHRGNVYIRTTRKETAILYSSKNHPLDKLRAGEVSIKEEDNLMHHEFKIGGSCTLKSSDKDVVTVIGAGVTLHEALSAYEELKKENINIRVIDLYSIKPIDVETIKKAAQETKAIITVEDHNHEGGLGEAVLFCLAELAKVQVPVKILCVHKEPHSGKPEELLAYEEIDKNAIIKAVKKAIS